MGNIGEILFGLGLIFLAVWGLFWIEHVRYMQYMTVLDSEEPEE